MRNIGIDKRDPEYRHFYYDDSLMLSSNPPQYQVNYVDDESEVNYVDCRYVIKIKSCPGEEQPKNVDLVVEQVETPPEPKKEPTAPKETITSTPAPKKRGRKKKVDDITIIKKEAEPMQINIPDMTFNVGYEYSVIELEFINTNDLANELNSFGDDNWELCSAQLFTDGFLSNRKKILVIFKRKVMK